MYLYKKITYFVNNLKVAKYNESNFDTFICLKTLNGKISKRLRFIFIYKINAETKLDAETILGKF